MGRVGGLLKENIEHECEPGEESLVSKILSTAYSQMGLPYQYGGASPKTGFDCSGFVKWVFANHGVELPRTTKDLLHVGVPVAEDELRPGDLVLYSRSVGRSTGHVGIYTGNGKFIHSPHTGDRIKESDINSRYRQDRFVKACRVVDDPLAAPLPAKKKQQIIEKALAANRPSKAKKADTASNKSRVIKGTRTTSSKKKQLVYKVKKGDTIYDLAKRFGVSSKELQKANGLGPRGKLSIGQALKVSKASRTAVRPKGKSQPAGQSYQVKKGDSIWILARRFKVASKDLLKANNLTANHTPENWTKTVYPLIRFCSIPHLWTDQNPTRKINIFAGSGARVKTGASRTFFPHGSGQRVCKESESLIR